jgi:hypothetical protein
MNFNPLDPLWEEYKTTTDSLMVFRRAVKTHQAIYRLRLLQRTFLAEEIPTVLTDDSPNDQFIELVERDVINAQSRIEKLFVVSLWAEFERFLRTYLQNKGTILKTVKPTGLGEAMYTHFSEEEEYWKPDEILDFLKWNVLTCNEHLAGEAKDIYRYRSAIVHGRPLDKKIYPNYAHAKLSGIIAILLQKEEEDK